ncbi:MAG: ABC transporter permease [Bacteroidia bacterium]|nr:ABC transporter permease subunit [Bacteroidia bacterium]MCZ2278271.1 ABC transporter permease [Bacteroidia bacterium]
MLKIIKYVLLDIIRSRTVIGYTLFLLLTSWGIFLLDDSTSKSLISLVNIILVVLPLVSIIFSTIHFYNSYEFIELMLAQPVKRATIFTGSYIGAALALCLAYLVGAGIPLMIFDGSATAVTMIASGLMITLVFVSLAYLAASLTRDKAKGTGIAILTWFFFAVIYDALLLLLLFLFADYPVENFLLGITFLNPVDLARLMVLLKMDVAALMGMTGAVYSELLGSLKGMLVAGLVSLVWVVWPFLLSLRIFNKKDI